MVVLTFAAFGVVNYKISQDKISIEDEARKISPTALDRSLGNNDAKEKDAADKNLAPSPDGTDGQADTCALMSYEDAKTIALAGECGQTGGLRETHFCNEGTKTWWIDMDIQKPGCNPACVVNVETKTSEINWRCTGLMVPDGAIAPSNTTPPAGMTNPGAGDPGAGSAPIHPPTNNGAPIPN